MISQSNRKEALTSFMFEIMFLILESTAAVLILQQLSGTVRGSSVSSQAVCAEITGSEKNSRTKFELWEEAFINLPLGNFTEVCITITIMFVWCKLFVMQYSV